MKYDAKRRQAATSERLCDCGRQAVVYKSNSYVCTYCLSQAPASAYLDHGGSACAPDAFPVRLALYDPEATTCMLAVLALLLSILPGRADYAVESSTNLTEWSASSVSWPDVLEMARTNPATPGKPHYYYRLSPEAETSSATSIPQDLAWNYATNLSGDKVWWASDPTNLTQLGETTWVISNPAQVFYALAANAPAQYMVASSTHLTEWTSVRLAPEAKASDGFHAARQTIPPPPPAPIKERVSIGDPFFPIPSRRLAWTYDPEFSGLFEIWWGSDPSNLILVGETKSRSWQITVPARLGWFGVRARTLNGLVSKWSTVPNLK